MDTVTLIGRLLISLAAVLGVLWLLGRRMRKNGRGKDGGLIEVLGRQQLGRNSSVAVLRVGEQALVVGVTDSQVSVLGETDLETALATTSAPAAKPAVRPTLKPALPGKRSAAAGRRRAVPAPAPAARRTVAAPTAAPAAAPAATPAAQVVPTVPITAPDAAPEPTPARSPLAGSAISPQTWKQTIESLRELTTRS